MPYANAPAQHQRATSGLQLISDSSDSQLRATTLHELVFVPDGSERLETTFDVKSPGVRHILLVDPIANVLAPAEWPLATRIKLMSASGEALIDKEHTFELKKEYVGGARPNAHFNVWDSTSITFTPKEAASHRLTITSLEHLLPKVHLRVEDPNLKNGRRAAGY